MRNKKLSQFLIHFQVVGVKNLNDMCINFWNFEIDTISISFRTSSKILESF